MKSYLREERLTVSGNVIHHSKQGMAVEAAPSQNPGSIRQLLITGPTGKQRAQLELRPSYTRCKFSPMVSSAIPVVGDPVSSLTICEHQGHTWHIDRHAGKPFTYLKKNENILLILKIINR